MDFSLNINRERLREAINFFSKGLKNPTKMMIYKVIAELDFRHFRETGLPVTNLEYQAWKYGPVPYAFDREISDRANNSVNIPSDFTDTIFCLKEEWENSDGRKKTSFVFKSKQKPNLEVFTPRQKRILQDILFIYKKSTATTASKASHEVDTPWAITIRKKGKEGEKIDYFDLLVDPKGISKKESEEMIREISAFNRNFKI